MLKPLKKLVPASLKRSLRATDVRARAGQRFRRLGRRDFVYDGICAICGEHGTFQERRDARFAARSFPCPSCGAALRFRNEAAVILDEFGRGRHLSLRSLVDDSTFSALDLYNTGVVGPVRDRLTVLSGYVESLYVEGARPGDELDGVQHQDLQALSFDDESFDLITSSHVLEHVADPSAAWSELFRVLRPGGRLIFSVPIAWPPPRTSVSRASVVDGEIVHHLDAVYHDAPGGEPSLVFTDFGTDLLDALAVAGFQARQQRPHSGLDFAFRDSVFVGIKAPQRSGTSQA